MKKIVPRGAESSIASSRLAEISPALSAPRVWRADFKAFDNEIHHVSRTSLCFDAEDPDEFAARIARAKQRRKKAAELLATNLYVIVL